MVWGLANEMLQVEDWGGSDGIEEGAENPNIVPPLAEASKIIHPENKIRNCLYLIVRMQFEKTGLQHS